MTPLRPTAGSAATRNRLRWRPLLTAALCLALPRLLIAQSPASTPEPQPSRAEDKDETITLSLFEVRADQDRGYQASGTLAGTRLRTELRDVAASVSVVTKDFMNDIGSENLGTLLNYTVGTEVAGLGGNYSGSQATATFIDFDSVNRSPSSATRFRGLSTADTTRDFFLTSVPLDAYNTDRIELNRGANSMLFGLGSPAGIINTSLIKADARKDKTRLEVKYGRFGSVRHSLDHNEVLIKDRLALRVALLHDHEKFQQEPAYVRDGRIFGTLTYQPFRDTKIRISGEWADQDSNKPQSRPPMDSFSWWWDVGQPVYDPTTNKVTLLGSAPSNPLVNPITNGSRNGNIINSQMNSQWTSNVAVILEDPNRSGFGLTGYPDVDSMEARNERSRRAGSSLVTGNMASLQGSRQYQQQLHGGSSAVSYNFWRHQQLSDPAIFDFYNQMLEGPNKYEFAKWNTVTATIEQQLFDGSMGFEIGYDHEDMDSGYYNPYNSTGYTIYLDINTKLANGDPNPNFGRPFIADFGWASSGETVRDAGRASAYYDLDLKKYNQGWLGRVLGRHVLNGNFTKQEVSSEAFQGRPTLLGLDHYNAEAATYSGSLSVLSSESRRALVQTAYIGPSVIGASGPQNTGMQGITVDTGVRDLSSVNSLYFQSPPTGTNVLPPWETRSFSLIQNPDDDFKTTSSTTSRTRAEYESLAAVLQSRWLDEVLISTIGWRRDDYETFEAGSAPYDPASGLRIIDENYEPRPSLADTEETFNYGLVLHSPRWLLKHLPWGSNFSLTYNKSDNFRPTAQRFTPLGNRIDPESGETDEYGVRLEIFHGKMELRATHYRTASTLATNNNLREIQNGFVREPEFVIENNSTGLNADKPEALAAWNEWLASPLAQQFLATFNYQQFTNPNGTVSVTHDDRIGTVVSTSDVVAKGWEFEAILNPTPNWRISMNAARQEAVRSNTAEDFRHLLEDSIVPVWTGPAGDLRRSATSTETLRDYTRAQYAAFQRELMLDGSSSPEVRRWRFNAVTNYRFSHGLLKGWNVGGAVRYQDRSVIGYSVTGTSSADAQYDIDQPYYGPSLVNYDGWIGYGRRLNARVYWQIQFNMRNIGVGNELTPVSAQPDGSIAAWRIREPMVWSVTNTLTF